MPDHITADGIDADRVIDGVPVVGRDTIARLSGKSRKTVDTAAGNSKLADDDFPQPFPNRRVDRAWWYPVATVADYLNLLSARDAARRPQPVNDGDDDELLGPRAAAAAIGVTDGAFRAYVTWSQPHWAEGKPGYLPIPDQETPATSNFGGTHREWRRGTLRAHQATRPGTSGPGAGAGRPTTTGGTHHES